MKLYLSRKEQYAIAILLIAIIGALFILSYAYGNKSATSEKDSPLFRSQAAATDQHNAATATTPLAEDELAVHVAGAVNKPGLYIFHTGARINDAIKDAGGARSDGYADALNLAAKLHDGDKLYVPTKEEWAKMEEKEGCPPLVESSDATEPQTASTTNPSSPSSASGTDNSNSAHPATDKKALPTEKISINSATKEQLMTLPNVGEVTAQHIIDYRSQNGKFTDISQLMNVPRIGPKTLEKLTPYITL
ncbi:MAG TPA: helix-hairpin-helix domain-containing protein [Armatimonadota bacterium]|nr:helix-hairpin-helix domain-containing protein [Armatimonadota bacterium]